MSGAEELRFPKAIADDMIEYCLDGRPNEACGLLAGDGDEVTQVYRMANASASPVRYALEPKEQLDVYRAIDDAGWSLGGVFHSHTRTEAYPSPTDVREAREDVPYVIVSLATDPPVIRAFRIVKEAWHAETGEIEEISVTVLG